jgi:hypothetical protein
MYTYFNEQIAADRRQTLLDRAERHRMLNAAQPPTRRRPLTGLLEQARRGLAGSLRIPFRTPSRSEPVATSPAATAPAVPN